MIMPVLWFLIKVTIFCYVFVWLRGALPRYRYDKLMDLGWKKLIPASLAWMLLVAGFLISAWWGVGLAVAVIAAALVLSRSFDLGAERELADRAVLPPVGRRPVPPTLLRDATDAEEEGT